MAKIIFGNKFISTSRAISGPSWVCYALMLRVCVCGPWGKHSSCSGCDCGILLGGASKRERDGERKRESCGNVYLFGSLCEACENNICNFKHLRRVASCLVIFQHHQYTHMYLHICLCMCVCACLSIFGCLALMTIFISIHYFLSLLLLLLLVITLVATLWLFIN